MKFAVFGASGYQGRLVLAELGRRSFDMTLVGRTPARLRAAADAAGVGEAETRIAAADDPGALMTAFRDADAVINCAGPFTRLGEAVVRASVAAGCHYVDTAGEQLYVKRIFDLLSAEAESAKVAVVPAANDGCVPGDLLARLLTEHLGPVEEILSLHTIEGDAPPSRGSARSAEASFDVIESGGLVYEAKDWRFTTGPRRRMILPDGRTVQAARFPVSEVVTIPRHCRVERVEGLVEATLSDRLSRPPDDGIIDRLPEGPTVEARRAQRFTYVLDAIGEDGRRARGVVSGEDTYGTTAAIAVEGAWRLAMSTAQVGVLAPAQAYDPVGFLDALAEHNVRWRLER